MGNHCTLFIRPAANKYELASCDFWAENDVRTQPQLLSQWPYLIWRIRGLDLALPHRYNQQTQASNVAPGCGDSDGKGVA